MRIKVLGTQSPYNTLGHNCPGFLILDDDATVMLDCGSGSHSILNFPKDLEGLSIIISHLHRDHYNDIFNLQYASFVFHNQNRLENPINIYLPGTPESIYQDVTGEKIGFAKYHTYCESDKIYIGSLEISFCKTDHPVETYAVKISNGKKMIVYTSDTSFSCKDRLVGFAKGADLLICESSLLVSHGFPEIFVHLTAKQAGVIAKESGVNLLMLTHFWPEEPVKMYVEEAKSEFDKTFSAQEGQCIVI